LDLLGRPLDNLNLSFSTGYLLALYGDGRIANPLANEGNGLPGTVDVTGQRVYTSPHWSMSTSLDWKALEQAWGNIVVHGDGTAISKEYFNAANSLASEQNGYSLWNGNVTVNLPDKNL